MKFIHKLKIIELRDSWHQSNSNSLKHVLLLNKSISSPWIIRKITNSSARPLAEWWIANTDCRQILKLYHNHQQHGIIITSGNYISVTIFLLSSPFWGIFHALICRSVLPQPIWFVCRQGLLSKKCQGGLSNRWYPAETQKSRFSSHLKWYNSRNFSEIPPAHKKDAEHIPDAPDTPWYTEQHYSSSQASTGK